jgi:hypothetical protein
VILGRLSSWGRAALLFVVLPGVLATGGCRHLAADRAAPAAASGVPSSSGELGALIVTRVPSGLPRLPDADLTPPAGAKRLQDIASYSSDPAEQAEVLRGYGYRFGWERFWGRSGGPMTGVFVDQFDTGTGAAAYSADLASNEAHHYAGMLRENPPSLPAGCRMLTMDRSSATPLASKELRGPSSFAWCVHGVFSVAVTAMAPTPSAADAEMRAVLTSQLDRLPR